jgi:hypothetical protein
VKVTEAPWPAEGFTVEGQLTASFDKIPEGTSVQHTCAAAAAGVAGWLALLWTPHAMAEALPCPDLGRHLNFQADSDGLWDVDGWQVLHDGGGTWSCLPGCPRKPCLPACLPRWRSYKLTSKESGTVRAPGTVITYTPGEDEPTQVPEPH